MLDEAMGVLESAARYRAGGDSWEEVSVLLSRPVRELKDLAWERRAEWAGLYVQAASFSALEALTDLARHENPFVAKDAAKAILTHSRWAGDCQPPSHQDHQEGECSEFSVQCSGVQNTENRELKTDLASLCLGGEEGMLKIRELANDRLIDLLYAKKPWVQLRAAQSLLVQFRWWWRVTHPRVPRERKPKGPDWKAILPWQQEDAPPPPDRISIHENSKSIGRDGPAERIVAFDRPGVSSESWEKTGAEADEYIRELVRGEKPGVEFMWYGHWLTTHLERIAGRDNIPWPPPEEMISGRWYAVWDEELRDIKPKPLPDTWQTGDPEPPDGWGPNSRASPN